MATIYAYDHFNQMIDMASRAEHSLYVYTAAVEGLFLAAETQTGPRTTSTSTIWAPSA